MMSGRLLTAREVARVLSCSTTHVRRLMDAEEMGVVWVSKRCPRVSERDLAVFLQSRRHKPIERPCDDEEAPGSDQSQ